ncbi:transcriptional repressor TCF25-domain-containing protein [Mycotypha africana]|uniref:transcriptional repressor TCF25-domain-containing protein n=1 Tax=Mycotypha africana TaxID=64632 RepID=UPI002300B88A|nr:transcriptional repressor TCF25-domain-containing protein [Mycotypha africana]KAI8971451.1 transcriptional repressor TCF25-domain-containing protein [Mycotypha africana]
MSSRALRRLQKLQTVDIVAKTTEEKEEEKVDEDDEDDLIVQKPVKQINPFVLLNDDGDDSDLEKEEEGVEDEQQVEKIKEKEEEGIQRLEPNIQKAPNNKKKNKSKKKRKNNKKSNNTDSHNNQQHSSKDVEDMDMKELEKVLAELGHKSSNNSTDDVFNNFDNSRNEKSRQLLCINYRYLDAEAEMKRLFGSHVVNQERRSGSSGRVLKKSKFTTPKSDWPPYKRNGLSMEVLSTGDQQQVANNGTTHYAFRHSEQYQDVQLEFLNAIATHSPDALLFVMRRYPYHVDTLLQLSEIAKHSGDWTAAGEFIERGLYSCERALHPTFSLSSGTARLSYKRSENRSFFLAVFRHIQFLTRRGCWRTAFEFNKMLFALDPNEDPLGALISMDYHALSAHDYDYVIRMVQHWKTEGTIYPKELEDMPNFAYSLALASFKNLQQKGGSKKNRDNDDEDDHPDDLLKSAIQKYPLIYCQLMEKLGESLPSEYVTLQNRKLNDYMSVVQLNYVERCYELWKEPEVLEWLTGITKKSPILQESVDKNHYQTTLQCESSDTLPLNICRYMVMMDIKPLLSYLPASVTSQSYHMFDPLPPSDSTTMYDINERMRSTNENSIPSLANLPTTARGLQDMIMNLVRRITDQGRVALNEGDQERVDAMLGELRRLHDNQVPGAFPASGNTEDEESNNEADDRLGDEEGFEDEDFPELEEDGDQLYDIDEEDLEVQRALAEQFERNNTRNQDRQ